MHTTPKFNIRCILLEEITQTSLFIYKERVIRIQKDPNYEVVQVPKLLNLFNRYILPEMLDLKISDKFAAKSILDDMVNIILNRVDAEAIQRELNQIISKKN